MSELEQTQQNQPTPTPRRRRKPRRPKWVKNNFTYQLWRNWPLIRLALIAVLVLVLLVSMISCSVKAIFGGDSGETTPLETKPVETTAPPETEPPATELLAQADFLAAGYDYEGAISLLRSSNHASSADFQSRAAQYEADSQKLG